MGGRVQWRGYLLNDCMEKERVFSGIQPSGNLHIGNYLGSIAQWLALQNEHEAIFCIVDQHAITVPQDPALLRAKTLEIAKIYLAAGIDPKESTLFVQSHVPEHTELMWILNTITKNGDLTKMTQFKSKALVDFESLEKVSLLLKEYGKSDLSADSAVNKIKELLSEIVKADGTAESIAALSLTTIEQFNSVNVGLFDYPVLMAADIVLYDTAVVPVGKDQLQHIELARTLARRFNERFGETFVIPEGRVSQAGQLIMGLDDPQKKMSKSAKSEYNAIALTDSPEMVRKKIKKAVTDSGSEIVYTLDKPALQNLLHIYALFSGQTPEAVAAKYVGRGYGDFKTDLAEVVIAFLLPFQERLASISDEAVQAVLEAGAKRARALASAKMRLVRERVGFVSDGSDL
jgi:tryptophanyl-tRNA synthetase